MKKVVEKLVKELKAYCQKALINKTVIGLSGGLDSAVCAAICQKALGKKNVHCLIMPELHLTNPDNIKDGVDLCHKLGITYAVVPINMFLEQCKELTWKQTDLSQINTKARIRMVLLYNYANANNCLVIGTSNKSELMLGYGTKHGDLAADVEVIGGLFKTEVIELAKDLRIPKKIIEKVPTAELTSGQTDEKDLGAPYYFIDQVLTDVEKGMAKEKLFKKHDDKKLIQTLIARIEVNKHKTSPIPILRAK